MSLVEELLERTPFSISQADKEDRLLAGLHELTLHHHAHCPAYARMLDRMGWNDSRPRSVGEVPFLPVSLFKSHFLRSVADASISTVMTSSGTTGARVSRIALDVPSAQLQARALGKVITHVVGQRRPPMLILDTPAVLKDPRLLSARGAGVLGMMRFGRGHVFMLDDGGRPDRERVRAFLERVGRERFLIFGFTYLVWQYLVEVFADASLDLSGGILIHSGGWKSLEAIAVDNARFRERLGELFNLTAIHNFYGMVEQIGSIHLEASDGSLYPSNVADVIIRDPVTWRPAPIGKPGVIQVLSLLPRSYPGHSVLTEDLGVITGIDTGTDGRLGKSFRVLGRVKAAELRGCSDVIARDHVAMSTPV